MNNIKRVKTLVNSGIVIMELIQSALSWDNKMLSAISFLVSGSTHTYTLTYMLTYVHTYTCVQATLEMSSMIHYK